MNEMDLKLSKIVIIFLTNTKFWKSKALMFIYLECPFQNFRFYEQLKFHAQSSINKV